MAQRLKLELSCWPESCFVTLTFRQADYPTSIPDLKRKFRHAHRGVPFRSFWVMERGDYGGRVHFHGLVFGQPFLGAREVWDRQWPYGRTNVELAKAGSPTYLARYILKEYESEVLAFHPDGLGEPLKRFPRKPGLGEIAGDVMARAELTDPQKLWCLKTTHDVSSVHRYDGRVCRTPRRVRERMRRVIGLPSSSPARTRVQAERRRWLSEQPDQLKASERRRKNLAVLDQIKADRERSSREYRDANLKLAERLFQQAVASGAYETRAARRRRLAEEREIEGAADLLLALSLSQSRET